MIQVDHLRRPRLGKDPSAPLTPGTYLFEKLSKQQSLPHPNKQDVGSGPSTGKYQRKKTFAAFERFKNAFKISSKHVAYAGTGRTGGPEGNKNSLKRKPDEQLHVPDKVTSPERTKGQKPYSGQ